MQHSLYYGEIATHITDRLYQYPDRIMQIDRSMGLDLSETPEKTLYAIIGQAAHIFATVQDLFEDDQKDWLSALKIYADDLLDTLLVGQRPQVIELLQMVIHSLQAIS